MITMSEIAAKKVSELRLEEGKPEWGLRIRVGVAEAGEQIFGLPAQVVEVGVVGQRFHGAPRSAPGLARAVRASACVAQPVIRWGGFEPSGESRRGPCALRRD